MGEDGLNNHFLILKGEKCSSRGRDFAPSDLLHDLSSQQIRSHATCSGNHDVEEYGKDPTFQKKKINKNK